MSLGQTELGPDHADELNTFLRLSSDFTTFFTSCTLADFRNLRNTRPQNLIYIMSHVSNNTMPHLDVTMILKASP